VNEFLDISPFNTTAGNVSLKDKIRRNSSSFISNGGHSA